jgi:ABC-type lipoprotein release transport system permease subunit
MVIAFAWRNVWRRRRRSTVTIGAIAIVAFVSLVYFGLGGAAKNSMYQALTEATGHVQIRPVAWETGRTVEDSTMGDADEVRAAVEAAVQVTLDRAVVVGVLDVPALVAGPERSRGVVVHGRDWPEEIRGRRMEGASLTGRFVEDPGDVVLGASLARALDVGVGDDVVVFAPGGRGAGVTVLNVVGTVELLNANEEIVTVWTGLAEAQEAYAPGRVGRFEIHDLDALRIEEDARSAALATRLTELLDGPAVLTWREVDPTLQTTFDALDPLLFGVTVIVFILAGLLVLNTVYLGVMERIKEFGVLHALGAGDGRVMTWIATESLWLCGLGALLGTAAGLGTVFAFRDGLEIAPLTEYYASFGFDPVFYLSVTATQVTFTVAFSLVTALLAAAWPAYLASRLEPVEAMRFHA